MNRFVYIFILAFLFSCTGKNRFPGPVSEKILPEQVKLLEKLKLSNRDSSFTPGKNVGSTQDFGRLSHFQDLYFEKKPEFNLVDFEKEWTEIAAEIEKSKLNFKDAKSWFGINGTLMQITGDAKYAEEMQKTLSNDFSPKNEAEYNEIEKLVAPYIFTKNVDHIHVNLFIPAEIQYEHTMHGKVKIRQETHFPDPEYMTVKFGMEERRYIEVFVRVPSRAEGATVTVKGVKYIAPPGDYAFIAKKWREGDVIEIHFPKSRKAAGL
jgi:hypothetical protein